MEAVYSVEEFVHIAGRDIVMRLVVPILCVAIAFFATGCSSKAGPFVSNISSDGEGGVVVEKCMVRLDRMINTVETADCTNTSIKLRK